MIIRERNPPLGIILLSIAGGLVLAGTTIAVVQGSKAKKAKKAKKKEVAPTPTPMPIPTPKGNGGGGGSKTYNKSLFPDPAAVRKALMEVGYDVEQGPWAIGSAPSAATNAIDKTQLMLFQRNWNAVVAAVKAGKIAFESSKHTPKGNLAVDAIPGASVLNALEVALAVEWQAAVQEANT